MSFASGSRGGRTSNVHAAVDAKKTLLRLTIPGGQLRDIRMMHDFLDSVVPPLDIVANKAYGSKKIRQQIADENALAVTPLKSDAPHRVDHDANL
ncbi:transposase [Ahrensia sp. 13_GOM-1096m]|uniref:transposase n=1 Tax=Ahrensia sp. 13_GOM-1096m TaxID=1380380 RepID=UPI0012DFE570|nr:transposase [Ahrensia sp. 13_GOM-1096m]